MVMREVSNQQLTGFDAAEHMVAGFGDGRTGYRLEYEQSAQRVSAT